LSGKHGYSVGELASEARVLYKKYKTDAQDKEEPDIKNWNTEMVCNWLSKFKEFVEYVPTFQNNAISGPDLLELTEENLKVDLSIPRLGHRKRILREIVMSSHQV